jgi:hypothetical protein
MMQKIAPGTLVRKKNPQIVPLCAESAFYGFMVILPVEAAPLVQTASLAMRNIVFESNTDFRLISSGLRAPN